MNAGMRQSIKRKQATIEKRDRLEPLKKALAALGTRKDPELEEERHEIRLAIDAITREYQ